MILTISNIRCPKHLNKPAPPKKHPSAMRKYARSVLSFYKTERAMAGLLPGLSLPSKDFLFL
jgi:hypothetical protein